VKHGSRRPGGIEVHVKGKNLAITPGLHDHVVQKMRGLDRYMDRLHDIEVELSTEPTRAAAGHNCVEATTHVLGSTVRVMSRGADMYAAVDEAVDKLYRQLNRRKERIKSHHRGTPAEIEEPPERDTEPSSQTTFHVERVEMKPQFEDEAAEDMEDLGRNFHMFLNARTEQVNVVYRRSDGSLGLIEPLG